MAGPKEKRIEKLKKIIAGLNPSMEKTIKGYKDEIKMLQARIDKSAKAKAKKGFSAETEKACRGVVLYSDGSVNIGALVGFTPFSAFEFIVDNIRSYRVLSKFITIKYEYQGDEETYNPSWAQSS